MSKIINCFFDNKIIEECEAALHQVLVSEKKLQVIEGALLTLHPHLTSSEQIDQVNSLIATCESRRVDRLVEKVVDQAQNLQKSTDGAKIRRQISHLLNQHALSAENRQLIQLAKKLLCRSEGKEAPPTLNEEQALDLLEAAGLLFADDLKGARAFLPLEKVETLEQWHKVKWPLIRQLLSHALQEDLSLHEAKAFFKDLENAKNAS